MAGGMVGQVALADGGRPIGGAVAIGVLLQVEVAMGQDRGPLHRKVVVAVEVDERPVAGGAAEARDDPPGLGGRGAEGELDAHRIEGRPARREQRQRGIEVGLQRRQPEFGRKPVGMAVEGVVLLLAGIDQEVAGQEPAPPPAAPGKPPAEMPRQAAPAVPPPGPKGCLHARPPRCPFPPRSLGPPRRRARPPCALPRRTAAPLPLRAAAQLP